MAIRRIAVEEAFVTPEIMAQWHVVLAGMAHQPYLESASTVAQLIRSAVTGG